MLRRSHASTLIVCVVTVLGLGCAKPETSVPAPKLLKTAPGLVDACGSQFANLLLPVGTDRDVIVSLDRYLETSAPEVVAGKLCRRETNIVDVGWGLFALGMARLSGADASQGYDFIMISASEYHNPMAMAQLARIHFYGSKRMQLMGFELRPDRTQAVVYLSAAFRIGQLDATLRGSPMVRDRVKATLWSITERLNALGKSGQFDQRGALLAHKERIIDAVESYRALYF
ncbi:MAG: TPR repeat protein [Myxococcota bacterium]|jgi:TPR repeat protein